MRWKLIEIDPKQTQMIETVDKNIVTIIAAFHIFKKVEERLTGWVQTHRYKKTEPTHQQCAESHKTTMLEVANIY